MNALYLYLFHICKKNGIEEDLFIIAFTDLFTVQQSNRQEILQ